MSEKASPGVVVTQLVKEQALTLRASGANYRQIAEHLKVSVSTAYEYVNSGLEELQDRNRTALELSRNLQLMRLDAMLLKLWPKRDNPRTADTILRLMEREAKLLGLDAPMPWKGFDHASEPIPAQQEGDLDLSKLSLEQLNQLEAIVVAAGPAPVIRPLTPVALIARTNGSSA